MKNNLLMNLKTLSILFICLLTISSCKLEGTDTGNPIVDDGNGQQCGKMKSNADYSSTCVLSPKPLQQAWVISQKLSQCFRLNEQDVYKKLDIQPELSKELIVDTDTYQQLHGEYQKRKIAIDLVAFDSCLAAITAMDCESGLIQNSLVVEDQSVNYTNVHSVLQADPSCKTVYSYK